MWIYVFGSLSRGEVDFNSDVDVLCIYGSSDIAIAPISMQKYSEADLVECFKRGDLFAYHLYFESKLIYASDGRDIIRSIGEPSPYRDWGRDLESFIEVALYSVEEIEKKGQSVFRSGLLYMSLRDIAMIYSHIKMNISNFSKYSPYQIDIQLNMDFREYELLRLCRISSTRGITHESVHVELSKSCLSFARDWIFKIKEWKKDYA